MGSMELVDTAKEKPKIYGSDIEMRNPLNILTNDTVEILLKDPCGIFLKG